MVLMIKKVILWPSAYGLPTWWLSLVILALMRLSYDLSDDVLPLGVRLLIELVVFLAALVLFALFTKWLAARLKAEPFGHNTGAPHEHGAG